MFHLEPEGLRPMLSSYLSQSIRGLEVYMRNGSWAVMLAVLSLLMGAEVRSDESIPVFDLGGSHDNLR